MEKILKIEEGSFEIKNCWQEFDGYQITTDQQVIKIGITNMVQCCEEFGCIITNDEIEDFIGAELIGISITDDALNNKRIKELEDLYEGGAMFVNLETNKGLLQFVAYNSHYGYYGHDAVLVSKQMCHSEDI